MASASTTPRLTSSQLSSTLASALTITTTSPPSSILRSQFTPSSLSATPSETSSSNSSGPTLQSSSSLYLYTFLATLVLLLGVSGAIVIRSFILRRRHQALVEEAIRNGTWVPPPFGATRDSRHGRRDIGEKPTMWEAWVGKDREVLRGGIVEEEEEEGSEDGEKEKEKMGVWNGIVPISATYLNPPNTTDTSNRPPLSNHTPSRGHTTPRAILPWRRNNNNTNSTAPGGTPGGPSSAINLGPISAGSPSSTPPVLQTDQNTGSESPSLRLTVLIAMPTAPSHSHSHTHTRTRSGTSSHSEDGPPVVEFGVLDVGVGATRRNLSAGAGVEGVGADMSYPPPPVPVPAAVVGDVTEEVEGETPHSS